MQPQAATAMPSAALFAEARGVTIVYPGGMRAVADLDLDLENGTFVAVVGPSGCGKSTLLKALAGLLPVTGGRLRVGAAASAAPAAHDVAFVFQHPTLLSWRTVAGNVRLPLELRGEPHAAGRIADVLDWVGLGDVAAAYPPELSGGMQMRASLARALVTRPHLLLMDEPFAALDDLTRQRLNEDVSRLWLRDRWTALFVTHNVSEAVFLAQRVLVMSPRPGRITADLAVDLPYPRERTVRTTPAFQAAVARVSAALATAGGVP